jgi:glycosyltransferase involved in cell wall biosynthesis
MRWYGHVARLCAVSHAIADEIVAEAPQLRDKVRALPNALTFPVANASQSARERTLLFVGRVHPEKGIEIFVRALQCLPRDLLADWKIRIVGPHEVDLGGGGDDFLEAMQQIARGSDAQIAWVGKIFDADRLTNEYRGASIFVYPSVAEKGETFGLAPLEAMAQGCVPVVSDLACFREYLLDNVNGFVFDHRAPEPEKNLGARLVEALRLSPEDAARMREAARAKAAEFEVENVAPRYLADFASLLKK